MKMALLALGGAAAAATAMPVEARHSNAQVCSQWRNHHCVSYRHSGMRHAARWRTGYVFGPHYGYTSYTSVPRAYRTRYHLSPNYRYVYNGGYIYVVDPTTYAITRILNAL